MNPTSKSFPVQVTLYDINAGAKTQRTITLAAGELKSYQNFLDTVFGSSGAGTVRFQSGVEVGGSSDNLFDPERGDLHDGFRRSVWHIVAERWSSRARTRVRSASGIALVDAGNRANVGCFNESTARGIP